MSVDKPWSSLVLAFVIIPRYLDTHNAISGVAGHKITKSFWFCDKNGKAGIKADILPKKQFLFIMKVPQEKIAWFSSSTLLLLQ